MSSRPSMELDDVPGKFPDFGAIFMSNNATRKECFRRNLLGLPIGQAHFVMQVKAGMILFLFEFEKRQLHGVFQACSDGALNIVPHAFSSSGKQFPAQVRVLPIWNCSPLHENEFRDAIRENYYSANKFKFGLSERQVRRLLSLFSVRKLKDEPSMREYIQNKVARPIAYYRNEVRSAVEDGRSGRVDRAKDQRNAGSIFGSEFLGDSISNHGREIDDERRSSRIARNRAKDERNAGSSFGSEFLGDSISNHGREIDDGRRSGRIARNRAKDEQNAGGSFGSEFLGESISSYGREVDDDRRSGCIARNRARDERNASSSFGSEFLGDSISNYGREVDDDRRSGRIARNRAKEERNAGCSFGSEFLGDSISNHGREIDDDRRSSRIARNRDEVEKHQFSYEHFIDQLGQVGRSVYDDQIEVGDRDVIRNEGSMNIEPRSIGMTNFPGHSYSLTGRGHPDDLSYVTGYELGLECGEDNRFHPPILGENDGHFQPDPPLYSVKSVLEANSLIHDQSRQSPSLHQFMDPQSSGLSFSALYGDTEPGAGNMARYPGHSLDTDRRGQPDASFQMSHELGSECKEDICFQPCKDPGLFQYNPSVYSINPTLEASSFLNDLNQQLTCPSFEPQDVDSSLATSLVAGMPITRGFSASYGDAVATRPLNYDQDVQSLNNRQTSSTSGISNSAHESPRPFNNIFPSREGCFFASHGEPKGTSRHQNIDNSFSAEIRLSYPNHYDDSNKTSAHSRGLSPVDFTRNFSENEMIDVDTASRSFGLDKDPSPMMDYRYPLSSQQEDHSLVSSSKNPGICKNSGTMYSQDKNRRVSVFSRIAMPLETHEQDEHKMVSSVDEVMDVLHQSRQQWLKSKSSKQLTAKRDEVSRMRSNNLMMFTSNPSKIAKVSKDQLPQISKQKDQLQQISKHKDQLPQISMELTHEDVLVGEANDASKAEEVAFRDFKRRSKVTKSKHDGYNGDHDASTVIIGASGWQHRKRKLVRPKFNEPCDDHIVKSKDANTTDQDKSDRVTVSPGTDKDKSDLVTGSPGRYNKMRKLIRPKFCEIESPSDVILECKVSEYNVSQMGIVSDPIQHNGDEERNPGTEIGSKCKEENIMGGSVFARNAGKERKESLENVCNQTGPCQVCCEDESYSEGSVHFKHPEVDGLLVNQNVPSQVCCEDESNIEANVSFKHPEVDELPVHFRNSKLLVLQEIFGESCSERAETEMVDCELGHDEGNAKLFQSVEAVDRCCPTGGDVTVSRTMTTSSYDNPEPERASKGISNGKNNEQLLSLEPIKGLFVSSLETTSCYNKNESQDQEMQGVKDGFVGVASDAADTICKRGFKTGIREVTQTSSSLGGIAAIGSEI